MIPWASFPTLFLCKIWDRFVKFFIRFRQFRGCSFSCSNARSSARCCSTHVGAVSSTCRSGFDSRNYTNAALEPSPDDKSLKQAIEFVKTLKDVFTSGAAHEELSATKKVIFHC